MGIHADRNAKSASLELRQFNLIYGFNGSGKSTLSRLFASLQAGVPHSRLPEGCSFEVSLDDGSVYGHPSNPAGLEKRVLVFNADYIEQNLQWSAGFANPVFYIGAEQTEAAAELTKIESEIVQTETARLLAVATEKTAEKAFGTFKRERAKSIAAHLHLGSRKYEAPAFSNDYDSWKDDTGTGLTDAEFRAAEETRRLAEPMPTIEPIVFDEASIGNAYRFIVEICAQSLATIALDEIERHPSMLMWVKHGHEFHSVNEIENCLYCGNVVTSERRAQLNSALDNRVDEFISRLGRTAERLSELLASLSGIVNSLPLSDTYVSELRERGGAARRDVEQGVERTLKKLQSLQVVLEAKQARPASPADLSALASEAEVIDAATTLGEAIASLNVLIGSHNTAAGDFNRHKNNAEIAIRRHFLLEARSEFAQYQKDLCDATLEVGNKGDKLDRLKQGATELRQKIRAHGPAAAMINKLVASYLGHGELTIHPMAEGYQLQRHGTPITGIPSEGEKTAIAISYFLSSIEAENRKLKDVIVVVDDPVSSLDTKALNFACSLVRGRLEKAGQVIILTHNLQCMNEFRKAWKGKARPPVGKDPTATFLFIDVAMLEGQTKRTSTIVEMSKLLREYDSEYHFLFSHILKFIKAPDAHDDHGYMLPNVMRRVLDVFLAFKCPGSSGLIGQMDKLYGDYPELDRDRLRALERLSQIESHSDNLDDLLSFSSMTLEETRAAANALIEMMEHVDPKHLAGVRKLCN
ncbi:wobble nucleotide-excising tRNase [Peteryoungia aggregata LMG 23059]|uniref:Wobble nucleotide-excising tRNase n=1 Tax=Peteryoungia aggregata LMG 23059 TaxID=1368425 RepID=A0ABU0G893_9HYPH|nr:AAA family ATPase [Peteryoungia aggregata]MDQ0420907.1 wobble nucleotide-excising tRNase [Peteryoungia aggregata LMG 23059]